MNGLCDQGKIVKLPTSRTKRWLEYKAIWNPINKSHLTWINKSMYLIINEQHTRAPLVRFQHSRSVSIPDGRTCSLCKSRARAYCVTGGKRSAEQREREEPGGVRTAPTPPPQKSVVGRRPTYALRNAIPFSNICALQQGRAMRPCEGRRRSGPCQGRAALGRFSL